MDKVFNISIIIWRVIFLVIQVINFSFFIAVMNTKTWFTQKWDYGYSKYTYRGGLLDTRKDMGFCDKDDSFKYCYDECEDLCDSFSTGKGACEDFCERLKYWHDGGAVYVAFQTIATFLTFLIAIVIILSFFKLGGLNKIFNLFTTAIMMIFVFVCNILAFVIYAGVVKLKYDDCTHDYDYDGAKSVCGKEGARFALFILIWLTVVLPVYFIIALKVKKTEVYEVREKAGIQLNPKG